MITLLTFILSLFAFVIALLHAINKGNRPPLWFAVVLLALGQMLPWIVSMSIP